MYKITISTKGVKTRKIECDGFCLAFKMNGKDEHNFTSGVSVQELTPVQALMCTGRITEYVMQHFNPKDTDAADGREGE